MQPTRAILIKGIPFIPTIRVITRYTNGMKLYARPSNEIAPCVKTPRHSQPLLKVQTKLDRCVLRKQGRNETSGSVMCLPLISIRIVRRRWLRCDSKWVRQPNWVDYFTGRRVIRFSTCDIFIRMRFPRAISKLRLRSCYVAHETKSKSVHFLLCQALIM